MICISGVPHYKYKAIKPQPCRNQNDYTDTSGVCMFQYECLQSRGKPVGYCVNSWLVGSCCKLPPLKPQQISSSTSVMSHFTQSTLKPENESSTAHTLGVNNTTTQKEAIERSTTSTPIYTNSLPNNSQTTEIVSTITEIRSNPESNDKNNSYPTTASSTQSIPSTKEEPYLSPLSTNNISTSFLSNTETTTSISKTDTFSLSSNNFSETIVNTLVTNIKNQTSTESIAINTIPSVSSVFEVNLTTFRPSVRE